MEPGVTFRQLYGFLQARESKLMLSVTGSTPDSSPVGNALERGAGSGPCADRAAPLQQRLRHDKPAYDRDPRRDA